MWNFPRPCSPAESRGFTFLEVMVAVSILAIVLLALFRLHSQTIALSGDNRFRVQATMLAQAKMAQWEIKPPGELFGDAGDFGDDHPGFVWEVNVEDVHGEALGALSERFKRLTVTVKNGDMTYDLIRYRFCDP